MITQINQNFNPIKIVPTPQTPIDSSVQNKFLPIDAKVLVEVLNKIGEEYKILINGKLFISDLPANFNKGDVFIAKIIGKEPITISLTNLLEFSQINDPAILKGILKLLKIPLNETAIACLKAFAKSKRPVIKEKLKEFIDSIEKNGSKFDDYQLNLLVNLYFESDKNNFPFDETTVGLFAETEDSLFKQILSSVVNFNSGKFPSPLVDIINSYLILDLDSENIAIEAKEKNELIYILDELEKTKEFNQYSVDLNFLKIVLTKIVVRNTYLGKISRQTDFLIIKNKDGANLSRYRFEKINPQNLSNVNKVILNAKTNNLGDIETEILLNLDKLYLKFTASTKSLEIIDSEKEGLVKTILEKHGIQTSFTIANPEVVPLLPDLTIKRINFKV